MSVLNGAIVRTTKKAWKVEIAHPSGVLKARSAFSTCEADGDAKTFPDTATSNMPSPIYPQCAGSWPAPPVQDSVNGCREGNFVTDHLIEAIPSLLALLVRTFYKQL
jgi:hypothetical protein